MCGRMLCRWWRWSALRIITLNWFIVVFHLQLWVKSCEVQKTLFLGNLNETDCEELSCARKSRRVRAGNCWNVEESFDVTDLFKKPLDWVGWSLAETVPVFICFKFQDSFHSVPYMILLCLTESVVGFWYELIQIRTKWKMKLKHFKFLQNLIWFDSINFFISSFLFI